MARGLCVAGARGVAESCNRQLSWRALSGLVHCGDMATGNVGLACMGAVQQHGVGQAKSDGMCVQTLIFIPLLSVDCYTLNPEA